MCDASCAYLSSRSQSFLVFTHSVATISTLLYVADVSSECNSDLTFYKARFQEQIYQRRSRSKSPKSLLNNTDFSPPQLPKGQTYEVEPQLSRKLILASGPNIGKAYETEQYANEEQPEVQGMRRPRTEETEMQKSDS